VDARFALAANTVLSDYRIVRVVGVGGFGITYEAMDLSLATTIALKEYYPFDFGERDRTMSVRPKSERHKKTFEWGRSNFLQEAQTLARFEHSSIVRVIRVFEANSTAYMVMRFERGQNFEAWLRGLGRPPTQAELDAIVTPLLDALQMMHAADFLHRDIAPDNVVVRTDGTPVLLDFGSSRRAVAEMSRTLTGIVKAGFSPHEQYTSNNRLQGPWSDLYALGGTLYRAVTGAPPIEAILRLDDDRMVPATLAAKGNYRSSFLAAVDACLKVRQAERPRSVAQLRPMLLGLKEQRRNSDVGAEAPKPSSKPTHSDRIDRTMSPIDRGLAGPRFAIAAAILVIAGAAFGSYLITRERPSEPTPTRPSEAQRPSGRLVKLVATAGGQSNDPQKGWLGVNMDSIDLPLALSLGLASADGVLVLGTTAASPAALAGLRFGDVLVSINGRSIANANDVRQQLVALPPGSEVKLEVWRTNVDDGDVLETLRRLAAGGNADVMFRLGRLYANGTGVARDEMQAAQWYRKGADAGNSSAMAALAVMLLEGRGTAIDQQEALRLLKLASANNNTEAMNRLGHILVAGKYADKDTAEAGRLFTKAAEAGHVPSMFELGRAYYNGTGVDVDLGKAAMWYQQAADLGHAGAMANLGWLYEHGKGVEIDIAKAVALYRRSADLGHSVGMVNLGLVYAAGKGMEKNDSTAVALYRKAAGLGNLMAMNNLAWMLQRGQGVDKDVEEAADLMMKALDGRNEFSRQRMTQFASSWTPEFRQAMQRRLRDAGLYTGRINGEFLGPTVAAVNAYFNRSR
jgi:TPR repeat protein/serine/threonine protein kinase